MVASFQDRLPSQLLKFFSYTLNTGYRLADEIIQDSPQLRKNAFGYWARSFLRVALIHSIAEKSHSLVPGLGCNVQKTRKGSYSYPALHIGNLVIVINHLGKINGVQQVMPRKALFRTAMTRDNSQQTLMSQLYPGRAKDQSDAATLCAYLCHEGNSEPTFAKLIVPSPDGRSELVSVQIDLTQTFSVDVEKVLDYEIRSIKKDHAEGGA